MAAAEAAAAACGRYAVNAAPVTQEIVLREIITLFRRFVKINEGVERERKKRSPQYQTDGRCFIAGLITGDPKAKRRKNGTQILSLDKCGPCR